MSERKLVMLPIGFLMIEHRLIERLIDVMEKHADRIKKDKLTDIDFLDNCIDFIKTYADICHHGKEEDILFRKLKEKSLTPEYSRILKELIDEHNYARSIVKKLIDLRNKYFDSSEFAEKQILAFEIYENLKELIVFYPNHIKKEDKEFFLPVMDYFTEEEKTEMSETFREFDRKLIHKRYQKIVENYEND
jgi:hemerythrin-like domain-containing protein